MDKKILIACGIIFVLALTVCFASEAGGIHMKLEKLLKENKVDSVIVGKINGIEVQKVRSTQKAKSAEKKNYHFNYRTSKRLILKVSIVNYLAGNYPRGDLTLIYTEPVNTYTFKLLPNGKKKDIMHTSGYLWTGSDDEFKVAVKDKKILFLGRNGDQHTLLRIEPFTDEMVKYVKCNGPVSDVVEDVRGKRDFEFLIHENLKPYIFRLHGDKMSNTIRKIEIFLKNDSIPFQTIYDGASSTPFKGAKYFEAIDMNFDGFKDIRLLDWWGATGNKGYKVWLYEPEKEKFILHNGLRNLSSPVFNNVDRTIRTRSNGGHAGRIYSSGIWTFKSGKLICLEAEKQDYVREKNHYIKVKSKLIDGKMREISRKAIKSK